MKMNQGYRTLAQYYYSLDEEHGPIFVKASIEVVEDIIKDITLRDKVKHQLDFIYGQGPDVSKIVIAEDLPFKMVDVIVLYSLLITFTTKDDYYTANAIIYDRNRHGITNEVIQGVIDIIPLCGNSHILGQGVINHLQDVLDNNEF